MEISQSIIRPYGLEKNPNWDRIDTLINLLPQRSGELRLSHIVDERTTDRKLRPYDERYDEHYVDVSADSGRYLITYFSSDRDEEDVKVFSYDNTSVKPGEEMVEIIGDYWDASMVCTDLEIVRRAFKEFYETGDFWMENFFLT